MMRLLMLAVLAAVNSGCTSARAPAEIELDPSSVELEGWFHAQGE